MYDVCLGGHVACTTTTKKSADAIRKVLAENAKDLFQHDKASVKKVVRAAKKSA